MPCRRRQGIGSVIRMGAAAAGFILLSGCVEEDVSHCLRETEPIVLLREITSMTAGQFTYGSCINGSADKNFCDAVYFGADTLMRACMREHGYAWDGDKCQITQFYDEKCYQSRWLAKLPK